MPSRKATDRRRERFAVQAMHFELPSRDTVGISVRFDLRSQLYFEVVALDRWQRPAVWKRASNAQMIFSWAYMGVEQWGYLS